MAAIRKLEEVDLQLKDDMNLIEKVICNVTDIEDNEMREFDIGFDKTILLVKQNGIFFAIGSKCSHNNAQLSMGVLGERRVRCPMHGACFNIETGDIEDFPGLDSIPSFIVNVEQGHVKIKVKLSDLKNNKRIKWMAGKDKKDQRTFVIIGGGPCAQTCAETLRQSSFKGTIVMICKEDILPYDRTRISKAMDSKKEQLQLRNQVFFKKHDIKILLSTSATKLTNNQVLLSNGNYLKFDKVLIATGARAKIPNIPGIDLQNIFTLRTLADAHEIHSQLTLKSHVVILGSSFVALEAAAYCVDKVLNVIVIGIDDIPLKYSFGVAIGTRIMEFCQENKVFFEMNSGITQCIGKDGILKAVQLSNGDILKANILILGIGSELNTDFLIDSGILINENGSISTNLFMETNMQNMYAAGDIANSPIFTNHNELDTIGHYGLAQYHGKVAALNMCGITTELKAIPYFWFTLFERTFNFTGHGKTSEVIYEGNLKALKFVAFYFDAEEFLIGMASCQPHKSVAEFAEKLAQGSQFHKSNIEWSMNFK